MVRSGPDPLGMICCGESVNDGACPSKPIGASCCGAGGCGVTSVDEDDCCDTGDGCIDCIAGGIATGDGVGGGAGGFGRICGAPGVAPSCIC